MRSLARCWPLMLWVVVAAGCAATPEGKSPLAAPRMHPDSVVLDCSFVRFPWGAPELNSPLWAQVDEQAIPLATRRALADQGFRVGIISGNLPSALEQLLAEHSQAFVDATSGVLDLQRKEVVSTQHVQVRTGQRVELAASEVYPDLSLLEVNADGTVTGHRLEKAECRFQLEIKLLDDGRVRCLLAPEVHHGEPQNRPVMRPELGVTYFEPGRARQVFPQLRVESVLSPGEVLVIGAMDDRPGSMGQHFFTTPLDSGNERQQKLLLVRLSQTQHDALPDDLATEIAPGSGPASAEQ